MMGRPSYFELPSRDIDAARSFYAAAFGWELTGFGPDYACTMTGDVDVGLQGDPEERSAAPLPVLKVDDLEAALVGVRNAGGRIVRDIFTFPGGRRFHFLDPNGNELAVMSADAP